VDGREGVGLAPNDAVPAPAPDGDFDGFAGVAFGALEEGLLGAAEGFGATGAGLGAGAGAAGFGAGGAGLAFGALYDGDGDDLNDDEPEDP
jgi:hypothetical protein